MWPVLHGDSQTPGGFFFVSNTCSIPELESSFFTPASPSWASCNYSLRKQNWVWTQIDNWVFILNSCNPREVVQYRFNARDVLSFQVFLPNWTVLDKVLKATFLSHLNKERYCGNLLYLYVNLEWHWQTQYQIEIVNSFLFVWICHALKERVKYSPDRSILVIPLHILHISFSFFWWIVCSCQQ
jgi:hypothetical protein